MATYLIFQGISPCFWGPLSDARGRRFAFFTIFLVYIGACIGLGKTKDYTTLMVLRCLQSAGSASTSAIGSGVIGDITTCADRGSFMGTFQAGFLVPTAIGPIVGGMLSGALGWRSIFWFLAIYGGVFLLLLAILLPETLRAIVGNGSRIPSSFIAKHPLLVYQKHSKVNWRVKQEPSEQTPRERIDLLEPFRILVSKQALPIILFLAIYYAAWLMGITATSHLLSQRYGLDVTQIGLTFIANGVGSIVGTLVTGKLLDIEYHHVRKDYLARSVGLDVGLVEDPTNSTTGLEDDFPLETARLRLVPYFALLQCAATIVFGWTIHYSDHVHISIPITSTFVTGWCAVSTQSIIMTYLTDVYSGRVAAANASFNLTRSLFAAGGTSFIMPMLKCVGIGLGFTICTIVQIISMLAVAAQWRYGVGWRREMDRKTRRQAEGAQDRLSG